MKDFPKMSHASEAPEGYVPCPVCSLISKEDRAMNFTCLICKDTGFVQKPPEAV